MIIVGSIHQMNGATKVKQMQKLTKSEEPNHIQFRNQTGTYV